MAIKPTKLSIQFTHLEWNLMIHTEKNVPSPKLNIAPENGPSQKESSLPTTNFQGLYVSFREGSFVDQKKSWVETW